jgi:hypothetical protein
MSREVIRSIYSRHVSVSRAQTMNKRKPKEDEQAVLNDWKRALIAMDDTLRTAQTSIRQMERAVRNIRARVGTA